MSSFDKYLSHTGRHLHESAIRRMHSVVARAEDLVSFAAGYPDPRSFPWGELQEIARELLTGSDPDVLQYGPTRGYKPLREAIIGVLHDRGIKATAGELLITSGSQQGLDLVARVLISPGDAVFVELPSYTGCIAAFRNAQAHLVGVPSDESGIDLDALDAALLRERAAGRRAHLLYLIPNFQNPTGSLLTRQRRQRLVEWAERQDVLIVEDDPYGALYFEDVATAEDTRPIRADGGDRVIYLSTFSKTLAPGFRVGWMVGPAPLMDRFETAKQTIDLTSGVLDQRIVHEALRRDLIDRLAPHLRQLYQRKRTVMEDALRRELGTAVSWPTPRGGFFLWATLPPGQTDVEVLERAVAANVAFVIGSAFYVDGTGHEKIRLSFSAPPEDRLVEGVRRLAGVMAGARTG